MLSARERNKHASATQHVDNTGSVPLTPSCSTINNMRSCCPKDFRPAVSFDYITRAGVVPVPGWHSSLLVLLSIAQDEIICVCLIIQRWQPFATTQYVTSLTTITTCSWLHSPLVSSSTSTLSPTAARRFLRDCTAVVIPENEVSCLSQYDKNDQKISITPYFLLSYSLLGAQDSAKLFQDGIFGHHPLYLLVSCGRSVC